MKLIAAYKRRVTGRPDSEHSQAVLRIGIVVLVLVYTAWLAASDAGDLGWLWPIGLSATVFSVGLFGCILRNPAASPRRRILGAIHDNLAVTLWLYQAGPMGALYLFVYPFVTVGNGFRFGVGYLACSGLLGAVGIGSLVASAPAWQTHQMIGIGVFISHLLVTAYTGVLLRRLHRMQDQLQTMATHDTLTGLPNRRLFMDRLVHVLARRHRDTMACLYLDLDGFKGVNDRYGHQVGDHLLKAVAERVTGCIRRSDLPARLGGDEFAVILDGLASPEDARAMAIEIINAIESIAHVDGHAIQISTSVGIAFLPAGELKGPPVAETLVRSADEAMYGAKKAARGQYRFVDCGAELVAAAA